MDQEHISSSSEEQQQNMEYDGSEIDEEEDSDILDYMNDDSDDSNDEQSEQQQKIHIVDIDEKNVSQKHLQYWKDNKNVKSLKQFFQLPRNKEVPKSVCAKIVGPRDSIIECFDCRMDASCIICMQCFNKSNHQGHRYAVKKAFGGCCDCGDAEAWNPKGFCKDHTGEFVQFQIPKPICEQVNYVLDPLFYQYFRLIIKKNSKSRQYTQHLIMHLIDLNRDNPYYNKLTALCLNRSLPTPYNLNQTLDKRSILQNILTSDISGTQIGQWFQLFTLMFPYYPFKMSIVKHYISNFGLIVNGSKQSLSSASSISCQLITSYKLIEQYSLNNKTGLGQNTVIPKNIKKMENYYYMLLHDLKYITGLTENAPLAYWKMHINNNTGISKLFYYQNLMKKWAHQHLNGTSEAQKISHLIDFVQVENRMIELISSLTKILPYQKQLLIVIKFLWGKCAKTIDEDPNQLPMFRVQERCLAVLLFKYFNYSLGNITKETISQLTQKVLKVKTEQFEVAAKNLLIRMFRTYFHYAKCMAEPGFSQTMYPYLYFYKIKSKLMSSLDILALKMYMLLYGKPYPLNFDQITEFGHKNIESQNLQGFMKEKKTYFDYSLSLLSYLYIAQPSEIYWAYQINPECGLYEDQIENILKKISKQKSGKITQEEFRIIKNTLIHPEAKFPDRWIKQNGKISKQNKSILLQFDAQQIGINLSDFWTNIQKEDKFGDPRKTINLITQRKNQQILRNIWNPLTIASFKAMFEKLYPESYNVGIEAFLKRILHLQYYQSQNSLYQGQIFTKIIETHKKYFLQEQFAKSLGIFADNTDNKQQEQAKNLRIKELKAKKMNRFKQKQRNFHEKLSKGEQFEQKIEKKISNQSQMQDIYECCICRNDNPQNFVFLVDIQTRNHEKLLNIGEGVQCITFKSCRHTFDHKCVEKLFKGDKVLNSITCPLCKTTANLLLPINPQNQPLNKQCMDRIIQILYSLQDKIDLFEQLLKSFYHYILLCVVNFQNTFKKRGKLYKLILKLISQHITQKHLNQLKQRLQKGKCPTNFQRNLKQTKRAFQNNSGLMILRRLIGDNAGAQQIQLQMPDIFGGENSEQIIKKPVEKNTKNKSNKKKKKEQNNEYSDLFKKTMTEMIVIIEKIIKGEEKVMNAPGMLNQQCCIVKRCLRSLTDPDFKYSNYCHQIPENKIYEEKRILKTLPERYTPLGALKKCQQCGEISFQLIMCLMCGWTGCQNINCERGLATNHLSSEHGNIGAFLQVQKAIACYITNQWTSKAGFMYQDSWGNPINLSKQWDEFELNHNLLLQMQKNILNDEIMVKWKGQ